MLRPRVQLRLISAGSLAVLAAVACAFIQDEPDPNSPFTPTAQTVQRHEIRAGVAGLLWTALWMWLTWRRGSSFSIRWFFALVIGWALVLGPSAEAIRSVIQGEALKWTLSAGSPR